MWPGPRCIRAERGAADAVVQIGQSGAANARSGQEQLCSALRAHSEGTVLFSTTHANRIEAAGRSAGAGRSLKRDGEWRMELLDAASKPVFRVRLIAEAVDPTEL